MNDLFKVPTYNKIGGFTATELLNKAEIIKTLSNDYWARSGKYDLQLTDVNEMAVDCFGYCICTMTLSNDEYAKLKNLMEEIENKYANDKYYGDMDLIKEL